jgi:uncharacterized protein
VLLWREYQRQGFPKALETLLAHNVQDVLNLETLAVFAFNQKLKQTPLGAALALPPAQVPANPFRAHPAIIQKCLRSAQ